MAEEEAPALARPLDGVSVAIVEDFDDARTLYTMLLTLNGARVTAVGSVAEAKEVLEQGRVDVLVSDINMPEEDGLDLVRWVRARPEDAGGRIPAIAITAHEDATHRELVLDAGFDVFLGKPIEAADLVEAIRELVARD